MTRRDYWGAKALACAFAVVALVAPSLPTSGAPQEDVPVKRGGGHAPAIVETRVEPPVLDEVDEAIRLLAERGSVRHVRLAGKTGRAAALFGDLAVPSASKAPAAERAAEFLSEYPALVGASDPASELALAKRVDSPAGAHLVFAQRVGDRKVFDAIATVHVGNDGEVYGLTSSFVPAVDAALGTALPTVDEETALAVALDRLGVTSEALRENDPVIGELGIVASETAHLAWRLVVPIAEPFAQWEIFVDAGTGDVIGEPRSLVLSVGSAKVFIPNPIASTGQTTLQDQNNASGAVPNAAYIDVELKGIDTSGFLTGTYVSTDRTQSRARATNGDFSALRRGDRGFNEVEAYWAIDTAQRYLQSLGIQNAAKYQIRVDAYAFADDNSNYTAFGDGTGVLNFGTGGVDDAQDAEIVWHEYGHAILDNQAQLQFFGESGAIHEGWGDYFAATMSTTVPGDSRFYAYVGEWDAVSYSGGSIPFLRRVDTQKRYPQDLRNQVHSDGEIWSSCLWALNRSIGREAADRIILNAHFLFPRDVDFEDGGAAVLESDRQLNGGANAAAIIAAFGARGIDLGGAAPVVSGVRVNKGKLIVDGAAFQTNGAVIEVDGQQFGAMKYPKKYRRKGVSTRIASKDSRVAQLARGVAVEVTVLNQSTGARSAPFLFTP